MKKGLVCCAESTGERIFNGKYYESVFEFRFRPGWHINERWSIRRVIYPSRRLRGYQVVHRATGLAASRETHTRAKAAAIVKAFDTVKATETMYTMHPSGHDLQALGQALSSMLANT